MVHVDHVTVSYLSIDQYIVSIVQSCHYLLAHTCDTETCCIRNLPQSAVFLPEKLCENTRKNTLKGSN